MQTKDISLTAMILTLLIALFLGVNEAHAMTYATGLVKPKAGLAKLPHSIPVMPEGETLPAHWDWRDQGLTPIQDQGQCGSCWAFSTTAAARDALKLFNKDSVDLSQQYLVDCDPNSSGCGGGYFTAFNLIQNPGSPSQSDYPYTAQNGRCQSGLPVAGKILSWSYIGDGQSEPTTEQIKTAIYKYGPVSVTVDANQAFMNYGGGVFSKCRYGQTNHMTDLVGWDDVGQYWIMRNSWGTSWGEQGYMRIKWTDSRGIKCNAIGEEAAFVEVK